MMSWQNYIAHLLKDHLFRVGRVNFNGYCNKSTVSSNACSKCNVWPDSIQVPEQNGNAYLHNNHQSRMFPEGASVPVPVT